MTLLEKIENRKKKIEMFVKCAELSAHSSYPFIDYNSLEIEDKNVLIDYFNKDSSLDFFYFITELLSFGQQEKFLLAYKSNIYRDIIAFYVANEKQALAIDYIERLLKDEFNLEYAQELMKLKKISMKQLEGFIIQAIETSHRGSYFIADNIKKVDKQDVLEKLWKKRNVSDFYDYLKEENRVSEMFALLSRLPHNTEDFFKQHKQAYKKEAIKFFNRKIEENLKTTGNSYYEAIGIYLSHLKDLIELDKFKFIVYNLKNEYRRRPNFMKVLEQRFGTL